MAYIFDGFYCGYRTYTRRGAGPTGRVAISQLRTVEPGLLSNSRVLGCMDRGGGAIAIAIAIAAKDIATGSPLIMAMHMQQPPGLNSAAHINVYCTHTHRAAIVPPPAH
jgi:hypothetical protein